MKTLTIAAALASFAMTAVPAAAERLPSTVVTTSDLDLTRSGDLARLDARMSRAADTLCRSGGRDLKARRDEAVCRAEIIARHAPLIAQAIARDTAQTRLAGDTAALVGA